MILVLTGTHHQPFDRLVRAAAGLAASGQVLVVQAGASTVPVPGARVSPWFEASELERLAGQADVIVCHAGPASLFLAWERGLRPVVVPRRPEHGEHVDDHQVRFAQRVADRVMLVQEPEALVGRWAEICGALNGVPEIDRSLNEAFCARFGVHVDDVVRSHRAPLRATLSRLVGAWSTRGR